MTPEALIDEFAFNMDAVLGSDFYIITISPSDWSIGLASGGVLFDYVGYAGSPGTRLGTG